MKRLRFKYLIRNLYNALAYDSHREDLLLMQRQQELLYAMESENKQLRTRFDQLQLQIVLSYFMEHPNEAAIYADELAYLRHHGLCVFPYEQTQVVENVRGGIEEAIKLPYVLHNNKKLYFPSSYSLDAAIDTYKNFIETENILGGGYRTKSPHQYQTESFMIEEGDVLLDVGCAEGLLTLDSIDKVSKAYLVESDPLWLPALEATFAPYKDKVEIINKTVSDADTDSSITIQSILAKEEGKQTFVKMDIEGFELPTLQASEDYISSHPNIKFACCTYHRYDDASDIAQFFDSIGRKYAFSDGYMFFLYDNLSHLVPPYFRKGIIRVY